MAVAGCCLGTTGVRTDSVSDTVLLGERDDLFYIHGSTTLGRYLQVFIGNFWSVAALLDTQQTAVEAIIRLLHNQTFQISLDWHAST